MMMVLRDAIHDDFSMPTPAPRVNQPTALTYRRREAGATPSSHNAGSASQPIRPQPLFGGAGVAPVGSPMGRMGSSMTGSAGGWVSSCDCAVAAGQVAATNKASVDASRRRRSKAENPARIHPPPSQSRTQTQPHGILARNRSDLQNTPASRLNTIKAARGVPRYRRSDNATTLRGGLRNEPGVGMDSIMWDVLTVVAVALVCLGGVVLSVFRGPGSWLVAVTALATRLLTDPPLFGWWLIGALFAMAVAGEALELLSSVLTAKRVGASRHAAWGGLIGGFAGMLFFGLPIPPPFGLFLGAMLGCFAGSLIGEQIARQKFEQSARVGLMSAVGFAIGTAMKLAIVMGMAGLLVGMLIYSTWFAEPLLVELPGPPA